MRITSLLATPGVRLLMPPAMPYRCVIFLLLLTSWGVVAASLWYGRGAMGLLHWVGVSFGGITGILVSLPRSWQRWRLAELGCDLAQGYFICRPLGVAELETWLQTSPWARAGHHQRALADETQPD